MNRMLAKYKERHGQYTKRAQAFHVIIRVHTQVKAPSVRS
jgi:hypothetical protein